MNENRELSAVGGSAAVGSGRVRVLIVDDQHLIREAISSLVTNVLGYDVSQASSGAEAIAVAAARQVDVVLLDVRMPEVDGLASLARLRQVAPDVPVLMVSSYADPWEVREALNGGASGYLIKSATSAQLREAISTAVMHDGVYVHPLVQEQVLWSRREGRTAARLSARERTVLAQACEGATNEQIGLAMSISRKTVKAHMSQIFRKLDVANRTEAVALAIRERLIGDPAISSAPRSAQSRVSLGTPADGAPWSRWPQGSRRTADALSGGEVDNHPK